VYWNNVGIERIVSSGRDLPLQRFLVGTLEVAQRFRSDFRDFASNDRAPSSGAPLPLGWMRGQFQFFSEDLRQLIHGEIHFQD